ncbi:MAG TPA: aspartyl/asparaginyl beta-hydroxylase domain-containing protein [Gammaproteobacteria bacterium]|nr:aspartyl/asparaginyl beta-hydroxylase domain-containing protein [Gammaproteobacteria bacterium]
MTDSAAAGENATDVAEDVARLARDAAAAARNGELDQAAAIYHILLQIVPRDVGALTFLGMRAFQQGDYETSKKLMLRAVEAQPESATLQQNLGMTYHAAGDRRHALKCFETAIALKPDFALAYFYVGQVLQEMKRLPEAIAAYRKGAGLNPQLAKAHLNEGSPPLIRELARRAEQAFEQHKLNLQKQAVQRLLASAGEVPPRLNRFLEQQFERATPDYTHPLQRPSFHFYPGLTSRPWFERNEFDWIPAFEAAFPAIRDELAAVIQKPEAMRPYVAHSGYTPEEWRELAGSADWNSYHLLRGGEPIAEHCEQCPRTAAALEQVPLVQAQGHAPEAFFSILAPGAHIPPHFGLANTKLAIHLPLIVPPDCGIRVGEETRGWREGECLIFDDSFEHEAWNKSEETRCVLICEVWNPELTPLERQAIQTLIKTADNFHRYFDTN